MSTCRLQTSGKLINVTEMKEGEIAQIKSWSIPIYISLFVQRCDNYLYVLGSVQGTFGKHWDNISWGMRTDKWVDCEVSVLGETEVLELRNN